MTGMRLEQVPARAPDQEGIVTRAGVRLSYAVYGDGPRTVLLMPTWSIIHSRCWKLQIPYLARHYRVVSFDGRGSGGSGRPEGAAAHANSAYAADAVAVLDATGTDRAVLVALSCGVTWSLHVAAEHPDRVQGLFGIAPSCGLAVSQPEREQFAWGQRHRETRGWAKYNKYYWLEQDLTDFREFFFGQMFTEPHSTKQLEDALCWSADVTARTLVDTTAGRLGLEGAACEPLEPVCAQVRCPVQVVHGTDDHVRPHLVGERLAELTGATLTLVHGGGHGLPMRDPVRINHLIRAFVDRVVPSTGRRRTWVRAASRPKRVLYLSSPIGLGHARRDLAIAAELRRHHPDLRIDWLAQHPVTAVLAAEGEHVHPASDQLLNESGHIEREAGEHELHAFQAIRRMDETLVNNFMVFDEAVRDRAYDLVVGDEAWEVDYYLHENPELKRFGFAWFTDFVGWLPMPDGGAPEAALTADYNAEMIEQRARFPRVRDRSIFVGRPEDVVPDTFGADLPAIRDWTADNFTFAGYITGFRPPDEEQRQRLRASLGYGPQDRVCVVTVGGSGVGESLLRRVLTAVPVARRMLPGLRFLVVTGPRIDPAALPRPRGTRLRGHLPRLYQHLAMADVAVVQGGLTTCMELTANRTPFLYVPLRQHFEQNFHVRHRLDRYHAGHCLDYEELTDPDRLAAAIVKELTTPPAFLPVESDGAERAAAMLAELL